MTEAQRRAADKRYDCTEKGKDRYLEYNHSDKGRERKRRYAQNLTPEQQEKQREAKRLSARRARWIKKHGNLDGFEG